MTNLPKILVIVGPTASGKTRLAIILARQIVSKKNLGGQAKKYSGAEIVSADSRQIYRGMDIGTAKINPIASPKSPVVKNIPCHLVDIKDPNEDYSVADYKRDAVLAINEILKRGKLPILVGGTGLYIKAVIDNLTIPEVKADPRLRKKIETEIKREGLDVVVKKLLLLDPEAASVIDLKNPRRVIRALEIAINPHTFSMRSKLYGKDLDSTLAIIAKQRKNTEGVGIKTNKPFSVSRKSGPILFDAIQVGIYPGKEVLDKRIRKRTKEMLKNGLLKEVKNLIKKYGLQCRAFDGIGYREIIDYLNGKVSLKEAEELINKHTIQYAKRQMTWFRKDNRIQWIKNPKDKIPSVIPDKNNTL